MKRIKFGIFSLALLLILTSATFAGPEHDHDGEKPAGHDMEEMMEAWAKLAVPGEHHAHLAKTVGTWAFKGVMWPTADSPEVDSTGTAVVESILGGRFFQMTADSNFMDQEFQGMGIEGYDNGKQKHIGVWFDSMGTLMVTAEGDCSDGGKVTTTYMSFFDPMAGVDRKYRNVMTLVDKDTMKYESYELDGDGGERKLMKILYKRQ